MLAAAYSVSPGLHPLRSEEMSLSGSSSSTLPQAARTARQAEWRKVACMAKGTNGLSAALSGVTRPAAYTARDASSLARGLSMVSLTAPLAFAGEWGPWCGSDELTWLRSRDHPAVLVIVVRS